MAEKRQTVSIHFEDRTDRPTFSVSGAYGGVTPDGHQVVMHVYQEWAMVPSIEQIPVEGNRIVGKPSSIKRGEINREIQATLVMTPEAAASIGQWLVKKGVEGYQKRGQGEFPVSFEMVDDDKAEAGDDE